MERILVVDDEPFICENLERILSEEGYAVTVTSTGSEALELLSGEPADLVLLDLNLPDLSGLDVLKAAKERDPSLLVIVITGYASVESAVQAIKAGAYDYLKKPFKADAIKLIVKLALETQRLKREVDYLVGRRGAEGDPIVAESPEFRKVLDQVREVAKHPDTTVLITGESGTGKELVARRVHRWSARARRPFLEVNCAALPETLLESELFGYEKGAFTGASGARVGLLEAAEGGSIFLDEIGEMDLGLQAKLLRVLEDKKV
ncbi:MAG: sigma-54-dependent Fis family transcriptional regulator, partial [Desulfacinum sp.]|nr:sigma-54-dependent Fis family transcriptional regulator [Desulfacinum sp.]